MEYALKINGLSKQFGKVRAVSSLDLVVPRGSIFGLLGPNGSGKSTTLGMVLGIVQPTAGVYTWYNHAGGELSRTRIGSLLEQPNFYPYLSARRNLELVAVIKQAGAERVDDLLNLVGLSNRANSAYKTFSTGMKQRLALAATLLADPEVIVLDEPTNGMDPQGIIEIRELIRHIGSTGKTVILASHLLDEVEKVCTHVAVLKQGVLLDSRKLGQDEQTEYIFIIAAENLQYNWQSIGDSSNIISIIWISDSEAEVTTSMDGTALNQMLFDHHIVLSKIQPVKQTLESQFLSITAS